MANFLARLVSGLSGKLLTSPSTDNLDNIVQRDPDNANDQVWNFIDLGSNNFNIQSLSSLLYLNVAGGSQSASANIIQYNIPTDTGSQWKLINVTGDGSIVKIQSLLSSLVLNVAGGSLDNDAIIIQYFDNGDAGNIWQRVLV